MLSINIPVYNTNVVDLVHQLLSQARRLDIDFEIRIYDDASEVAYRDTNRSLSGLKCVIYQEMPENLGRSAIRNKMGNDSKKAFLLFLDADSEPISDDFIKNYLIALTPGCVLCGGTGYHDVKPADHKRLLRWVYGRKRESVPAAFRNQNRGFIITSNNFLIDRQVFQRIHFRENIGPYGHEDTLLGYDLNRNGIRPLHIENPVRHTGLEDSQTFLAKTEKALENLRFISEDLLNGAPEFNEKVKFLRHYNKISGICSPVFIHFVYRVLKIFMKKNLTGKNPVLLLYDFYKIGYYTQLHRKK